MMASEMVDVLAPHPALPVDRRLEAKTAELEALAAGVLLSPEATLPESKILGVVSDAPTGHWSRLMSRDHRRRDGAFFTGSAIARLLAAPISELLMGGVSVYDPACGSGDLLLAAAEHLPVANTLSATIETWGQSLHGRDLGRELVRTTKSRLVLLAYLRCQRAGAQLDRCADTAAATFPNIRVGDGLAADDAWACAATVLMNPPFQLTRLPAPTAWGSGLSTVAASFLEAAVTRPEDGVHVSALLPDVLRGGPRYRKLRQFIEKHADVLRVVSHGRFPHADIDVILFHGITRRAPQVSAAWLPSVDTHLVKTVSDHFDISVGSVVPHRHACVGKEYRYIHAKLLPSEGRYSATDETRAFRGTVVSPPFVALRRTSSPDQPRRLVACLILGSGPVAVENHLVILRPKDGGVARCEELLRLCELTSSNEWVNERSRCRHLAIDLIKRIPWFDDAR